MIVSISGDLGSGKSTLAKHLSSQLGWPRYYMGGILRQMAQDRGMTLAEFGKLAEKDPSIDIEVDEYQKKLGENEDNFIIEGRTSWYFIPHSLKIFLSVETEEGARRIYKQLQGDNNRNEDNSINNLDDMIRSIKRRKKSEIIRYEKYFGIDVYDRSNYDFVIDTTNISKDETFEKIHNFILMKLKK